MSQPEKPRILALFDVDGTLTIPRGEITEDMMSFMKDLSKKITVGIVGGELEFSMPTSYLVAWLEIELISPLFVSILSHVLNKRSLSTSLSLLLPAMPRAVGSDLPKQEEQLGVGIAKVFPYNFSQNGLVAYKNGELLEVQTISNYLGEDNVKRIVNWVMKYLAELDLPVKVSLFFHFFNKSSALSCCCWWLVWNASTR